MSDAINKETKRQDRVAAIERGWAWCYSRVEERIVGPAEGESSTTTLWRYVMEILCGGEAVVLEQLSGSVAIDEPDVCPACGSPTTRMHRGKKGVVTYCSQPHSCPAVAIYRIKHYIGSSKKGIGILGIGDSVLEALTESLVKSPADLYRLEVEQIEDLQIGSNSKGLPIRLGYSRATSIVSAIYKAKRIPLAKFLGSLGVDLLGRRRVEILAQECGLNTLEDWLDDVKLAAIPGDVTRDSIIAGLNRARPVIDELLGVGVVVLEIDGSERKKLHREIDELRKEFKEDLAEGVPENSGASAASSDPKTADPIAGKTFCMTGTRECKDEIEARGGIIKSGISRALDYLIQKEATSYSNKTQKAEEYGVKILSIDRLKMILKGECDLPD